MTSHEVSELLDRLIGFMQSKPSLYKLLEYCKMGESEAAESLLINIETDKKNQNLYSSLKKVLDAAANELKGFNPRRIYSDAEKLKEEFSEYLNELKDSFSINHLLSSLDIFMDVYSIFILSSSANNTFNLLRTGRELSEFLNEFQQDLYWINVKLNVPYLEKPNYEELSIMLPYATEYGEVVTKLDALGKAYTELCNLLNVSTTDYKLEIRKIESGSLWVSVLGNAVIIGFIISLIKSGIGFIHRNFTTEGKISFIPRELEAADHILEFSKKVEEAGIDTSASRENVQKALFIISSKLNDLVADQPKVEVNGETFSVSQAQDERFLKESKRLLLEEGNQNSDSESG